MKGLVKRNIISKSLPGLKVMAKVKVNFIHASNVDLDTDAKR